MGRLLFAGDDADLDFLEAGGFEPVVQIAFGKAGPAIAVEFVGTIEVVLEQIENPDVTAGFEDFMGRLDGL